MPSHGFQEKMQTPLQPNPYLLSSLSSLSSCQPAATEPFAGPQRLLPPLSRRAVHLAQKALLCSSHYLGSLCRGPLLREVSPTSPHLLKLRKKPLLWKRSGPALTHPHRSCHHLFVGSSPLLGCELPESRLRSLTPVFSSVPSKWQIFTRCLWQGVGLLAKVNLYLLSLVLEGAGERYEPDGDGRERPGKERLHDQEQHPGSHLHFAVRSGNHANT